MKTVRAVRSTGRKRSKAYAAATLLAMDSFDSLATLGYTSLISSPDVASAVGAIADVISSATIHLMRNTDKGDERVKNELSSFMDIHPYSLGTRRDLISWIVTVMLTAGDGNSFVLPVTRDGYLVDLVPMSDAYASGIDNDANYRVQWRGRTFSPEEVLHFRLRPDLRRPWLGRGVRVQLKDILQNLKQSAATTNSFLSDKWKPSVILKVDALADEFSGPTGRKKLLEEYVDTQNAGEPWVIPADLMSVEQVKPLSLTDLAISDSVQLDRRSVAAAFGVPPFMVGVGEYNQDAYNNFIRRTVIPMATGIEQELTKKLLLSPDLYFKFNAWKLYAFSLTDLAKVGDDQYIRGIMTGNEVRDWINLSPKDGLDDLVILENYIPRGMIGDQAKLNQEDV